MFPSGFFVVHDTTGGCEDNKPAKKNPTYMSPDTQA